MELLLVDIDVLLADDCTDIQPIAIVHDWLKQHADDGQKIILVGDDSRVGIVFIVQKYLADLPMVAHAIVCHSNPPSKGDRLLIMNKETCLPLEEQSPGTLYDRCLKMGLRKPKPGLLLYAIGRYDLSEVLYVGRKPEDEWTARSAGVAFQPPLF